MQNIKGQIDALSNSQQMDMLRLQSLSNKRNEAFETMTNFIKKMQDNRNSIIGNMRRRRRYSKEYLHDRYRCSCRVLDDAESLQAQAAVLRNILLHGGTLGAAAGVSQQDCEALYQLGHGLPNRPATPKPSASSRCWSPTTTWNRVT